MIPDFQGMGQAEIREKNREITQKTRENAAWIGALWYEVEQRSLWKDWGHPSFVEAVVEEAPRAYSSVRACLLNYRHFVIEGKFSFEEFLALVLEHGMRNLTYLRQAEVTTPSPKAYGDTALQESQDWDMANQAKQKLVEIANTPRLWKEVEHKIRCDPEQEEIWKLVIKHVQSRVPWRITEWQAVHLLFGEYASEKAIRKPEPFKKAA